MYRNKLRNAYINWSKSCDYNVFGTLNFAVGQKVSLHQAEIAWRVFWNKVDRLCCKSVNRKQSRIPRHVFVHRGANADNPHIHFLAKAPGDVEAFCVLLNALWRDLDKRHAIPEQNEVLPLRSKTAASIYVMHEDRGHSVDSFSPSLSSHDAPVFRNDAIARFAGTLKRDEHLEAAADAYPTHLNRVAARIARKEAQAHKRAA